MVSMQISADENYVQQITWIFHVTNGPKDHGGMQDEPFEQASFKRWWAITEFVLSIQPQAVINVKI